MKRSHVKAREDKKPMEEYLRPCPKCGNAALGLHDHKKKAYSAICKESWLCGNQIGWYETEDEAIAAWNQQARSSRGV